MKMPVRHLPTYNSLKYMYIPLTARNLRKKIKLRGARRKKLQESRENSVDMRETIK